MHRNCSSAFNLRHPLCFMSVVGVLGSDFNFFTQVFRHFIALSSYFFGYLLYPVAANFECTS